MKPDRKLLAAGLALELALLAFWAFSGVWRGSWRLMAGFFLPGAVYLGLAWRLLGAPPAPVTRRTRGLLLGFSAVFHLTFLLTPHPLSNDLYRYFWDGKLLAHGVNPYAFAPADPSLAGFRDPNWSLIFNRDVPTGYPPLAEAVFALAYRIDPHPWALRAVAAAASLGTTALLMLALRAAGRDERRALLYGWSPLVALEFSNSAHLDALALFGLSAALLLALQGRQKGAAAALALGALVKFYPAVLLPLWGRRWKRSAWLVSGLVFSLPWLPFLAGGTPFTGLGIFARRVDFNSSLFRWIENAWYLALRSPAARLAALASVAAVIGLAYLAALRRRSSAEPVLDGWRAAGALFGLGLALSPVVHPWYVCWMLAFLVLDGSAAWLVLSVTIILARQVYIGYEQTGEWLEEGWTSLAVWLPFYLAWSLEHIRKLAASPQMKNQTTDNTDLHG